MYFKQYKINLSDAAPFIWRCYDLLIKQIWDEPLCSRHLSIADTFSRSRYGEVSLYSNIVPLRSFMLHSVHTFLSSSKSFYLIAIINSKIHLNLINKSNETFEMQKNLVDIHQLCFYSGLTIT